MIVGDAPNVDDDASGIGFLGKSGDLLRQTIADALKIDPTGHVSYSHAVACYGGSAKNKPKSDELSACGRILWWSVYQAWKSGTSTFIAAGKNAFKALFGRECSIREENGLTRLFQPPVKYWRTAAIEDFCFENGIQYPGGADGVNPDTVQDPGFISSAFMQDLFSRGFQFPDTPTLNGVGMVHPSYYLRDRFDEVFHMANALKVAYRWATGIELERHDKDYEAYFEAQPAIEYMNEILRAYRAGEIEYFALDLETIGPEDDKVKGALKPFLPGGRVLTINLSHKPHFGRVIYLAHSDTEMTVSEQSCVAEKYAELLAEVPVVGANLRFDMHWSRFKLGAKSWNIVHDTQLMHYAIFLGTARNDLKTLTSKYLEEDAGYEDDLKRCLEVLDKPDRHFENVPVDMMTEYAAHDVDVVLQIIPFLIDDLKSAGQWETYQNFLIHPYPAFIEMEQQGAKIDRYCVETLWDDYAERVAAPKKWFESESPYYTEWVRRRSVMAMSKRKKYKTKKARNKPIQPKEIEINFGSSEQVAELLFAIAGLEPWGEKGKVKKNLEHIFPDGVPTTGEEALENILENLHASGEIDSPRSTLLEKVMEYRKDAKILSGYLKKAMLHCPVTEVPDWWDSRGSLQDSRRYEAELYPIDCQSHSLNMTSTRTGRTSSSDPNTQQITKRMRHMYIPREIPPASELIDMGLDPAKNPRRLIANFDVGQAELRMLAVACQDPTMLSIMRDPKRDIHREIAAIAYNKPIASITSTERTSVKRIVFGTAYGRSAKAVAAQLKIPVSEAEDIQDALFRMMPGARRWIEDRHYEADTTGKIVTPTGRVRDLRMYTNTGDRHRRAVNTPIQGGASDLTLWATGHIHKWMKREKIQSSLWGFVHDSIMFDFFPQEFEMLMIGSEHYFSVETPKAFPWYNVPLVLEFECGPDWKNLVEVAYSRADRSVTFEGSAENITVVSDALSGVLGEQRLDPEWVTKITHKDDKGNLAPKKVWIKSVFI